MAIRLIDRYPTRANPATTQYPHGSGRNKSDPTADDGTPFDEDRFNDHEAFFQGLLTYAGITPSGTVDTVEQSDYLDAFNNLAGARQVDSVSALQSGSYPASLDRIWLSGYYGVGTAGGGPLYRDSSDTTTADNGGTVFVDVDGVRWKRPSESEGRFNALEWGVRGSGTDDDTSAISAMASYISNNIVVRDGIFVPVTVTFPPGFEYLITSTIDLDLPEDSSVHAEGAFFTTPNDIVMFDMNPEGTANTPLSSTSDEYTKKRIRWKGGVFDCTASSPTSGAALQAIVMRTFVFEDYFIRGFWSGVKFGAKDTYRFVNGYTRNCVRHYHLVRGLTGGFSGNIAIDIIFSGCHVSMGTPAEAGYYIDDAFLGMKWIGGSINGGGSTAQVYFNDNTYQESKSIDFDGLHMEQADNTCVLFNSIGGGEGFRGIRFSGGTEMFSTTDGWKAVDMDKCFGVKFGNVTLRDESANGSGDLVTIASNCANLRFGQEVEWVGVTSGKEINNSANRREITVEPENLPVEPNTLTSWNSTAVNADGQSLLDMSAEYGGFSDLLLPPKGYIFKMQATRTTSPVSTGYIGARLEDIGAPSQDFHSLEVPVTQLPASVRVAATGYVRADGNGDVQLERKAVSGDDEFNLSIAVVGVIQ